jgi:hypothetical protein
MEVVTVDVVAQGPSLEIGYGASLLGRWGSIFLLIHLAEDGWSFEGCKTQNDGER